MACKMNWTWLGDPSKDKEAIRCIVYTTFIKHGLYRVKIMLGETNTSPRDKPWYTGTSFNCKSHVQAFEEASKFAASIKGKQTLEQMFKL